jgi:hypothetical protein
MRVDARCQLCRLKGLGDIIPCGLLALPLHNVSPMDRNPRYFMRSNPSPFQSLIIKTVKEPSERRLLLEKGDVDIAFRISEDDIKKVEKEKGLKVLTQPSLTMPRPGSCWRGNNERRAMQRRSGRS